MSGLYGNPVMVPSTLKTIVLEDESGNEIVTGVVVGQKTVFDATPADVKAGKIFASDEGVQEGTDTKTYRTTFGSQYVLNGESFSITLEKYDGYNYTKFNAMISSLNTTISVNKIVINDAVYNVNSTTKLASVTKNASTKSIDLNITNNTGNTCVIYYSTYEEE